MFSPLAPDTTDRTTLVSLRSGLRLDLTPAFWLKANVGRSHRMPSFFELFGDRGGVIGNTKLTPEKGLTWDAGFRFEPEDGTVVEAVYFDHRYDDLIQFVQNPQGVSRPGNIGQARVRGTEATLGLTVLFAGVIGFGAALNASLIELVDRRREVATLHVMGYHPRQIAGIFFREGALVFACGMLLAVPLSWAMAHGIASAYDTEVYRMPVIFRARTVLLSLGVSTTFLLAAQLVVLRQIRRINWLEAIKTKE